MTVLDLFGLNEPCDLYRILHEVYLEYIKHPTERNFLFLVFGFTRLREWISESSHHDIEKKQTAGQPLSEGERFFNEIYDLPEFRAIQELCNRSKHYITTSSQAATSKIEGLRAGMGKIGDRLDQLYFLIDDRDSRDYFIVLIRKYNEWFDKHGA
jgi:hypothetical protein